MSSARIGAVAWGTLEGVRPRTAGSNARLGAHGVRVRVPILELVTDDGIHGFGACRATAAQAQALLGLRADTLFDRSGGVLPAWRAFDYPLWDLAGKAAGRSVYALAAELAGTAVSTPFRVPCYDTSLYFDDLHLASDSDAAALLADEARFGFARGHRAFKLKVGRGARHMEPAAGTRRDIAVVEAVRDAVGPSCALMLDANNGYTLNVAKQVLAATAHCNIFWLEEAFHEDDVLYRDLREWLVAQQLPILIADGEGQADPRLVDWARQGLVDVLQYDIFGHGFSSWLTLGRQLDGWNIRSAPHHYGGHYGNYAAGHLAGAIERFTFVEWDDASVPGLDTSRYGVEDGQITLPDAPGFGIELDPERFAAAVKDNGYTLTR